MMLREMTLFLRLSKRNVQVRLLTSLSMKHKENLEDRMEAWQIHSYGGINELKLSNARIPVITRPTDVLIKVEAASVNPIDIAMTKGYGAATLSLMRKVKNFSQCADRDELELPLTTGRDFSGIVVSKGQCVGDRLNLNDEVWGVVPVEQQGCHANYVVVDSNLVNQRPKNLSHTEAASLLYAGLTAWSALWITAGLCYKTSIATRNKQVLVLGGSGGVGTLAIQLLKAWNMNVITTCSTDAVTLVKDLGADIVIDYKQDDADARLITEGPYEIILDCCNQGPEYVKSKGYRHRIYITLNSPLLKNVDEFGIISGFVKNIGDLLKYNVPEIIQTRSVNVRWAFFIPSPKGIDVLQKLVEKEKIVPVVKEVYGFKDLPVAFERVARGHLRGKVIIDMK